MIEVDAGPDGDVELAIVRRMIALIREHYTGDFNWESQRLGRVVVLSAAPADNAELEDVPDARVLRHAAREAHAVRGAQLPRRATQIPASTTAPPTNCAAPIASPKSAHAKIAAITGWMSRLTEDSDAGRCAKA